MTTLLGQLTHYYEIWGNWQLKTATKGGAIWNSDSASIFKADQKATNVAKDAVTGAVQLPDFFFTTD